MIRQMVKSPRGGNDDEAIGDEDLAMAGRDFIKRMLDLVDHELSFVTRDGKKRADMFWEASRSARKEYSGKGRCGIGTRVRKLNGTMLAEWYRNKPAARSGDAGKTVYSSYIRKGAGHGYDPSCFAKEPLWARQIVAITEKRYALLRERAAALSKIRAILRGYGRLLDKCYGEGEQNP